MAALRLAVLVLALAAAHALIITNVAQVDMVTAVSVSYAYYIDFHFHKKEHQLVSFGARHHGSSDTVTGPDNLRNRNWLYGQDAEAGIDTIFIATHGEPGAIVQPMYVPPEDIAELLFGPDSIKHTAHYKKVYFLTCSAGTGGKFSAAVGERFAYAAKKLGRDDSNPIEVFAANTPAQISLLSRNPPYMRCRTAESRWGPSGKDKCVPRTAEWQNSGDLISDLYDKYMEHEYTDKAGEVQAVSKRRRYTYFMHELGKILVTTGHLINEHTKSYTNETGRTTKSVIAPQTTAMCLMLRKKASALGKLHYTTPSGEKIPAIALPWLHTTLNSMCKPACAADHINPPGKTWTDIDITNTDAYSTWNSATVSKPFNPFAMAWDSDLDDSILADSLDSESGRHSSSSSQ